MGIHGRTAPLSVDFDHPLFTLLRRETKVVLVLGMIIVEQCSLDACWQVDRLGI